jgi:hypothetical protein
MGTMRKSIITAIATLAIGLATAAAQTRDDNVKRCSGIDPDLAIGACAAIIQSGTENDDNLSRAFAKTRRSPRNRWLGCARQMIKSVDEFVSTLFPCIQYRNPFMVV